MCVWCVLEFVQFYFWQIKQNKEHKKKEGAVRLLGMLACDLLLSKFLHLSSFQCPEIPLFIPVTGMFWAYYWCRMFRTSEIVNPKTCRYKYWEKENFQRNKKGTYANL